MLGLGYPKIQVLSFFKIKSGFLQQKYASETDSVDKGAAIEGREKGYPIQGQIPRWRWRRLHGRTWSKPSSSLFGTVSTPFTFFSASLILEIGKNLLRKMTYREYYERFDAAYSYPILDTFRDHLGNK